MRFLVACGPRRHPFLLAKVSSLSVQCSTIKNYRNTITQRKPKNGKKSESDRGWDCLHMFEL